MQENERWKFIIDPGNKRFEFKFREVWQYRDLVMLFVKRDFVSKYKQMLLGPLWAVIGPIASTIVFTVVFGNLAKLPTMDTAVAGNIRVPSFLFYMIGNIVWSYFAGTVNDISYTFIQNARIMGKVYYPRLVSPISVAISGLITLSIRLIPFVILLFISVVQGNTVIYPTAAILLLPLLVLQVMLLSIGVGLIVSVATTKYRDVIMLLSFGMQLWFYLTPVVYGLQLVPENWLGLFMLNPVTTIVTTARYLCFGEGYFQMQFFFQSVIITALIFMGGVLLFNRAEKNFVDTI